MDHYTNIYQNEAEMYHKLITSEDVDGNLIGTIENLISLNGIRVIDLGSGTGRIPSLISTKVAQVIGVDLNLGMLNEHKIHVADKYCNWDLVQGDLRKPPFPSDCADAVIAGWAIGHFISWFEGDWENQIDGAILEMLRMVKIGGPIIVIETLGTGSTKPSPPTIGLSKYYSRLENKWGFSRLEISTDYQFNSLDDSVNMIGFFFGLKLAEKVRVNQWIRVPEWTGVWIKTAI
jgi:ubiquinone/menaquinone biosynthesis C-methylase UbiE